MLEIYVFVLNKGINCDEQWIQYQLMFLKLWHQPQAHSYRFMQRIRTDIFMIFNLLILDGVLVMLWTYIWDSKF
jgi:hypothetical protein